MSRQKEDPRVAIVVKVMEQARAERARRMILVRDARKAAGVFTMRQEATEIIAALDKYDCAFLEAVFGE